MKRNSLGWWLAASNVAIVLLVAAGISYFAIDMLRGLADSQQKIHVQLAGANAREEITRIAEDTLTDARVLAERPPLNRLLTEPGREGLAPFLRRFCETSKLDACAILDGGQVVAASGVNLPWPQLFAVAQEQGERFMAVPAGTQFSVVGAVAKLPGQYASFSVVVVHLLDDSLARVLSEHSGLPVRLINYRAFNATPDNEFTSLHSQAMTDGRFAVQRIDSLGLYASSFPVFSSSGEGIALIETRSSATETDRAVSSLVWRLILTAFVFAVLALVAGVLLGWRVTKPAEALTDAAVRLGQGDFATSIPTAGPAEIGQLARTMDDMRRNLVDLNSELRHREAEAQVVLEAVVEGVYAVDQERNIRYLNPQAARLLGIETKDAIGKFCGDVLKPCGPEGSTKGTRPCATTACPILRARQAGSAQAVEQLQTTSGVRQTVITSSRVVNGLQVQVLRDETELEGVRRARDTVLANVSHEFRTPLAAQLASIELLREGLKTSPPEKLEELVLSLERGTLRLTRLIDNLLESVRIESGQVDVRRQSIELADVVEDARVLVEALLRQRQQPLEVEVPEGLELQGDATRLTQVFVNLIANASKFAPEATPIRVGAHIDGNLISAWVEDSGPGLPEGDTVGIFERFKRGGSQEPEPGGLGLGLWISRSIVERHGGSIAASRTAAGQTRFTLTLPVEPDQERAA
ncbi:MAG TPA: ATP-binding protein [Steroidobacteraceae bacterium]|jgi:signal transduction histidine kinase|nr:ATP-binding protein [Steroidobacteraceae bacterium]